MSDPASVSFDFNITGNPAGTQTSVNMDLVASASLDLPGLRLAVDRMTSTMALVLENGDHGLKLALQPFPWPGLALPNGAMAELDLPGLRGGGYLSHSGDQWSGALACRVGPVSVNAFAIVTTDRFSLLALLAAEFTPAIQLSFGFTLIGVGGMVGINRRPDMDALQAAAYSGDLSNLLFPSDPVADAPRLLPVLNRCFPASAGDVVVGPMVKLGWGTPTLVAATIGVLVATDGVVILGRVAITLPFEQAALIRLEAIVVGAIDGTGLRIVASLSNSNIIGMPVEGDFALRIRTGSDALFALSAGGFHPAFTPPDGMAGLKRLGMEVSPGALLRARLSAYLAVTTDSVQFGAGAELSAGIAGFGIHGFFNFDALIVLDPFGFQADFSAGVSIECADFDVCSINLSGHFSGPAPYRIRGHASISILFFDVDVDIPELTWGPVEAPKLPPARDPMAVLIAELAKRENWSAANQVLPLQTQLRPAAGITDRVIHPMAQVTCQQSAVPVGINLQRMDAVPLPTPTTLGVLSTDPTQKIGMQPALFAPSQFFEQDDKTKLSSAGYVALDGGFVLAAEGGAAGAGVQTRPLAPDTSVLGKDLRRFKIVSDAPLVRVFIGHQNVTPAPPETLVTLRDPGVTTIASTRDLTERASDLTSSLSTIASGGKDGALAAAASGGLSAALAHSGLALSYLDQLGGVDVAAAATMQVVSQWEVASA